MTIEKTSRHCGKSFLRQNYQNFSYNADYHFFHTNHVGIVNCFTLVCNYFVLYFFQYGGVPGIVSEINMLDVGK